MFSRRKTTNDCCYRLTSSNVNTVKEMCSRWYRSQFNKFEKAWARVEILCLDFRKTPPNQNIKSSKVATFEICEIFSNYHFSYVRDYKATLAGGNYPFYTALIHQLTNTDVTLKLFPFSKVNRACNLITFNSV